MMAETELQGHEGSVLILAGDTPLLQGASLKALLDAQAQQNAACVIGTADTQNNEGLGRVVRNAGVTSSVLWNKKTPPNLSGRLQKLTPAAMPSVVPCC